METAHSFDLIMKNSGKKLFIKHIGDGLLEID